MTGLDKQTARILVVDDNIKRPDFRNEGMDKDHNPEFTMLEFYQAYATYTDLMDLTEALITGVAETLTGSARECIRMPRAVWKMRSGLPEGGPSTRAIYGTSVIFD